MSSIAELRQSRSLYEIESEASGLSSVDCRVPGEIKDLLNKVVEARTTAEAAVITRREDAAALRHQANIAKLFADHPTLLKLRELEAAERIAVVGMLNVVLGEKGVPTAS